MAYRDAMRSAQPSAKENMVEQMFREEKAFRQDRLVEKWANIPEIGRGIKNLRIDAARNLATLLENQTRAMSKMTEAQLASAFNGYTPENMLRLIRLNIQAA